MAKPAFKIGDRVRYIATEIKELYGKVGTIKGEATDVKGIFAVEFDKEFAGHNCDGLCKSWRGWWVSAEKLKKVNENKIIIFQQGDTVCAKLLENKMCIKVAEAKCSPNDDFDILVGAQIALQRLVDKQGSKHVINLNAFNDSIELIK